LGEAGGVDDASGALRSVFPPSRRHASLPPPAQGKEGDTEALALPDAETEALAAEKTRAALAGIIGAKVAAAKPFAIGQAAHTKEAKFIQ
jgi:hypothetical protein